MTARSGSETRRRSEQVGVRLTPDEDALLTKQAAERGMSPGEALRHAYFASRERSDQPAAPPEGHLTMPNLAYRCAICDVEPYWSLLRRGDAVVSWACPEHLSVVLEMLQRDHEVTEIVVTMSDKAREWAEIHRTLDRIVEEG